MTRDVGGRGKRGREGGLAVTDKSYTERVVSQSYRLTVGVRFFCALRRKV